VYKRSAVLDVGAYSTRYGEDFDLFWKLSRRYKIGNIEQVLLDYRVTSQSLHQVTRKKEYDEAVNAQVLRNIRYYNGGEFNVTSEEIDFFQFNIDPVVEKGNIFAIIRALRKLEKINRAILTKDNINYNREHIIQAVQQRKRFIWRLVKSNLSPARYFMVRLLANK
jgi:hypothetical protein